MQRRKARTIRIGTVAIGGRHPVAIQSMAKTKTSDIGGTVRQFRRLEQAGCEIVRVAVKDLPDARAIRQIKAASALPLVADIHFDWRLAVAAVDAGADKIRLNPGNIYRPKEVREVISAVRDRRIPLRVGVNSGSVRGSSRSRSMSGRLAEAALAYVRMIEKMGFADIVISLKASDVFDTVEAYRKIAPRCDYPLHLGVTATGLPFSGTVKSSIAIGALLLEGIGDTIRISLTDRPEEEIRAARAILEALKLRSFGPRIVSCPTCGRCEVDLVKIVRELERACADASFGTQASLPSRRQPTVAVMGCVVNGPGEAQEADIGIAFGRKDGLLFKNGTPVRKVPYGACVKALLGELKKFK